MKKLFLILLFVCSLQAVKAQTYQINAMLTGFDNSTKFYLKDVISDKKIDSAILTNGKLTLRGKITSVKALWLCCFHQNQFYFTNLLIGADQVNIKGDIKDFSWYLKVTGSKSQDVANLLNDQVKSLWKERDSLIKVVFPLTLAKQNDSIRMIIKPMVKRLNILDSTREKITAKFITEHLNSDAGLQQLYYKKSDYKKEELNAMLDKVDPTHKNSLFGKLLTSYQRVGNILKEGDQYYDFTANDLSGKKYELSAYKGKYILIDFVETYCAPCVEASADLISLSKKYTNELQIISFYVETDAKIVKKGLDRDKPTWPAIWDGQGHESTIKMKYGVNGFPTFVLIAPDGKIIMHSSGFSRDDNGKGSLESAVDRLLQKAK